MTIEQVIQYYGSVYKLNRDTKIAYRTVARWRLRGFIPIQTQLRLQSLTNGELKASLEDVK